MSLWVDLKIKNFRGIDHLEIEDLSRVNVFLGQNNSGKSSVLEAIAMLMGMSNPDLPQIINAVRARKLRDWERLHDTRPYKVQKRC